MNELLFLVKTPPSEVQWWRMSEEKILYGPALEELWH